MAATPGFASKCVAMWTIGLTVAVRSDWKVSCAPGLPMWVASSVRCGPVSGKLHGQRREAWLEAVPKYTLRDLSILGCHGRGRYREHPKHVEVFRSQRVKNPWLSGLNSRVSFRLQRLNVISDIRNPLLDDDWSVANRF